MTKQVPDLEFHATLLRLLGGKARVARFLRVDRGLVLKWHTRGIPSKYWHRIIDMAGALGLRDVTADRLEATKPLPANTNRASRHEPGDPPSSGDLSAAA